MIWVLAAAVGTLAGAVGADAGAPWLDEVTGWWDAAVAWLASEAPKANATAKHRMVYVKKSITSQGSTECRVVLFHERFLMFSCRHGG